MAPGNAGHSAMVMAGLVGSAPASAEQGDRVPRALYAGVAGTGRETEQLELQNALTRRSLADEVVVETDAEIALADAFGESAGIILIAGTGSIAFGRSPAGVIARCGGWGIAFGDEGSGAWIGRRALSVVAAAHDGREPETALTGAILTAAQVNEPEQLIPWAIAADKESFGALAPSVLAMAMQDDVRANSIIDMAVEELVLHIRALGKRLFLDDRAAFDVAFTGGLLGRGSLLRKRLERRLKTAVPGATVNSVEIDAARGAVKLALRSAAAIRTTP
ncbi:MAG: BadF/BadG/BcrA/BcrD ATPase family protein [Gemmatimonadaceae bacterium]